jgi:hypothetical protein
MRRVPRLLPAIILVPAALLLTAADKDKGSSSLAKKADPSGTGPLMGQLRALFTTWDVNKDGFLDKPELAWGFRGEDAKPYEPKATPGKDPKSLKDFAEFPDYQFLLTVDQNGDGKVNRDEFINWAREYAVLQKNIATAEKKVAKVEAKLTSATLSTRLQAQADLKPEREALAKLRAQLPPFEKALQRKLNPAEAKKPKK